MNFNFVSIPRCASQSIHNALRYKKYLNHQAISKFPNQDYFSFAVIREPVDRIRSWYSQHRLHKDLKEYQIPYKQWIDEGMPIHWSKEQCHGLGINTPLSQYDFISINGKIAVDKLLDYSKLAEEFVNLSKIIGNKQENLVCMGRSKKFGATEHITQIIKEKFPKDFELYEKVKNG